ncbi:hypothetical protein HXY32_04450 [Candidatus Bathyarchaeota archaeon]|nr:hypothetical protein [Candidatus Bathyarchaeota archaeon]
MNLTEQKYIMELFAGNWAEKYQKEHYRTPQEAPSLLGTAQKGLEYFLRNGFARAGGEQAGYGDIAIKALNNCVKSMGSYAIFMIKEDSPEILWFEFEGLCKKQGKGANKRVNEGVIKGFIKLAKESFQNNYNPFSYVANKIHSSMTDAFLTLRNIKGIGDKISAFLLRDIVCILDIEAKVRFEHRIFLQPIDRWIKEAAICLWEDLGERTPNWVIALRIIDKCNDFGVSGVRFNQGAWQYGVTEVKDVGKLRDTLENICVQLKKSQQP